MVEQSSSPTALPLHINRHLHHRDPAADIQLADSLMRLSPILVPAMLVIDSATAKRAEAPKSNNATGARSPIAWLRRDSCLMMQL